MDNVVCTLPIKPKSVTDIRTKIDPILVDFIGTGINYRKALAVNVLSAYNDKSEYLNSYLKKLNDDGIIFDDLYCDKYYLAKIIARIYKMIDEKIIVEASDDLLRCGCGKVDLPKRAVRQNEDGSIYKFENGKIICKYCKEECKCYNEKILKIDIDKTKIDKKSLVPLYYNNVFNGIIRELDGTYILISKKRDTGCIIGYKGNDYNIDIDFIWSVLAQIIPGDNKILIAGNRQILKMFNINYINCITENQNITFVAHPFMYLPDNLNKYELRQREDILLQKLNILYNLKWKNNNCKFTESIYKHVKNMTEESRIKLYNQMINCFQYIDNNISLEELLEKALFDSSNFQRQLKLLKYKM